MMDSASPPIESAALPKPTSIARLKEVVKKPCPECGKLFAGLKAHRRVKHPSKPSKPRAEIVPEGVHGNQHSAQPMPGKPAQRPKPAKPITTNDVSNSISSLIASVNRLGIHDNGAPDKISTNNSRNVVASKPLLRELPSANEHISAIKALPESKHNKTDIATLQAAPPHHADCVTCKNSIGPAWITHWVAAHADKRLPDGVNDTVSEMRVACPFPSCGKRVRLAGLRVHYQAKGHGKPGAKVKIVPPDRGDTVVTPKSVAIPTTSSIPVTKVITAALAAPNVTMTSTTKTVSNVIKASHTKTAPAAATVPMTNSTTTTTITTTTITVATTTPSGAALSTAPAASSTPVLPPPPSRVFEVFERQLRPQLLAYRHSPGYTVTSLPNANHSADVLEGILKQCSEAAAQGVYRSQIHGEVQRLVDRYYKAEFWDGCRDRMRELLTKALAVPHNSVNQAAILSGRLAKCAAAFVAPPKEEGGSKKPLLIENALKFWGGHAYDPFENHKYDDLTREIIEFVRKRMPTPQYRLNQREALKELNKIVQHIAPEASLELFGSAATQLDSVGSDMDCGVLGVPEEKFDAFLRALTKILRSRKDYVKITPIYDARIPLVKCTDAHLGIDMDISRMRDEQRLKTQLLLKYRQLDERFVMLTHVVKKFAQVNNLGDASIGGLNSFGWTLLVLQFCQMTSPPVLPNIQDSSKSWDGWRSANTQNLGSLLVQFFIFYTRTFHPFRDCVCIRAGSFSSAPSRRNPNPPPRRITTTTTVIAATTTTTSASPATNTRSASTNTDDGFDEEEQEEGEEVEEVSEVQTHYFQSRQQTLFCVEDPLDPTDNVGRGLVKRKVEDIYSAMCGARELLRSQQPHLLRSLLRPLPGPDVRWRQLGRVTVAQRATSQQHSERVEQETVTNGTV